MTSFRSYLLGLLVLFGGYVALEYYRPRPLDWSLTLSNKDKIPYGTYALYDVLPQLLGTQEVESLRQPIYNQFFDSEEPEVDATDPDDITTTTDSTDSTTTTTTRVGPEPVADTTAVATEVPATDSVARAQATPAADSLEAPDEENEEYEDDFGQYRASYLFVNQNFAATPLEINALKRFAAQGNDVFIAASSFSSGSRMRGKQASLLDSLGVYERTPESPLSGATADSVDISFQNPKLAGSTLRLPVNFNQTYFEVKAGHQGQVLATDAKGRALMIRLDYGQGHFLLCAVPVAFSNYYLLPTRTRRFALAALSYLPTGRPVWWDEYQKQGRVGEQSVLRVLLNHAGLRTAYYLLLATAALFIFVEARRRQRIIPVIKPLPNTTLLFTRTVASLYQQGSNHALIAEKKVALFLDYLRTRFHEPAPDLADEDFRERLSQKSGLARPRIDELVRVINFARTAPAVTDQQLLILSRAIRDFKKEAQ